MPLPPALLERLKRRKIIQETSQDSGIKSDPAQKPSTSSNQLHERYGLSSVQELDPQTDDQEEIIAADYSDEEKSNDSRERLDRGNDICGDHEEDAISDHSSPQTREDEYDDEEDGHKSHSERACETDDLEECYESVIGCPNKYNIYHDCNRYCKDQYAKPDSINPSVEQRKQLAMILRAFPLTHEWSVVYDPGVKTFYFWNTVTDQVSWFPPGMSTFSSPSADHIRRVMRQRFEYMDD